MRQDVQVILVIDVAEPNGPHDFALLIRQSHNVGRSLDFYEKQQRTFPTHDQLDLRLPNK